MELDTRALSVGEWLLTLLVQVIPVVGFVVYVYWALASQNLHRKRFCQAWLLLILLGFVLSVGVIFVLGGLGALAGAL